MEFADEDPTVKFTTVQAPFREIDSTAGDVLVVTDVSPQYFAEIEHERDVRRRKFRFRRYQSDSELLVITIPTDVHEELHLQLFRQCSRQIDNMGLQNAWDFKGTTTQRSQGHPGGDGSGEGDSSGVPVPERGRQGAWPTLVIEAGASELLHQLREDMRWWFLASNHDVKIVILAKFDRHRDSVLLEKWEGAAHPQGILTRSRAALQQQHGLEPILRQTITITRDTATYPDSYSVHRGALVLSFQLLFLRYPRDGERDVVLGVEELQEYAVRVWRYLDD
ncbi:hypothetical protein C8A05DRAFT_18797 [Staphylotrichum tortipilum]|uniref:Uncharacterized protein n=1 Tax=Staphylotrichum tortipilum TaxID=2831512 RepID=A0AAN6RQE7_9PEZI|nr:hypothetical protein C8A05DRAFT_18797 [Staphylotrichum longicolle]